MNSATELDFDDGAGPLMEPEPEPSRLSVYRAPKRPDAIGRSLPHSIEAEEHLLSCCMIDGREMIGRCRQSGVSSNSFYLAAHSIVFEIIESLDDKHARIIDVATVAEELKTRKQLDNVGGYGFLMQVSGRIPTTAQAGYFIEKVRELATLRAIIIQATGAIEECYNYTGGIEEFATAIETRISSVTRPARKRAFAVGKGILSHGPYPAGDDPNVLLGKDDYLGRGGGMLFVSHAGAGKSSFIMDACMSWAIGRPWMGIRSRGPLKSLIIQAEDSDRYVAKVSESFAFVANADAATRTLLDRNVTVVKLVGTSGPAFLSELARLVELHAPDLVVLNPLYMYADGDISKSESAQPFLVGLDAINRDARFAYIIVHHTGKPQAKGTNGKRAELEDWETIYMGFGSSYLANWPRCSALLEPKAGETGKYTLKLGKGGPNAGVTKKVPQGAGFREEPTTRIDVRWSTAKIPVNGVDRSVIYWEEDEPSADAVRSTDSEAPTRPGAKVKNPFSKYRPVFENLCPTPDKTKGFTVLLRAILPIGDMKKSTFNDFLDRAVEDGDLIRASNGAGYHLPSKL